MHFFETYARLALSLSGQSAHYALESHQGGRIGRKRPQKARQEPAPVTPHSVPAPHVDRRIPPPSISSPPVSQRAAKRVCHYPLLDAVRGVGGEPEGLRRQTTGPEVYRRRAERGMRFEGAGQHVVRGPPHEKEGSEEERCREAVVEAADAVRAELCGRFVSVRR